MEDIYKIIYLNDPKLVDIVQLEAVRKEIICCKLLASSSKHFKGHNKIFFSPEVWKKAQPIDIKELPLYLSFPVINETFTKMFSVE